MKLKLYDDYQTPAADKVIWALKKCAKALMVMATGLGKTIVSAFVVDHFLSNPKTQRVLVLCHDTGILKNLFKKYHSWFGDGNYTYAHYYGKKKKNGNFSNHTFVFATFQSKPHLFFKADHFDFIIVDEGHHAKAPTYDKVMKFFNPKWKLGMTATPDREDLQDIRHIFGKEVVNNDLPEAMARGWLTPVEYKILSDGLDRDTLQALVDKVSADPVRITESQLNEMIFIPARTEKQCESIVEYTRNGLKAIVFCSNIDHLNHVMEFLPNSVAVHSDQTTDENDDAMEAYEAGLANHILVVDKFNEGIDLPDTDVLVFLRSTNSYRIWVQQLGRGLRLFEGKHKLIVLDFVANIERIRNVQSFIQQIGSFTNTVGGLNQELKLGTPLHIEGLNFTFDFSEQVVSVLGMLEYMVHAPLWPSEEDIKKLCSENNLKRYKDYDKSRPKNYPHSVSFLSIYGKRFGEVVHGKKTGDWLPEAEIRKIYLEKGWKTYVEYNKNRPSKCPIASQFPKIYGKTFSEVVKLKKGANSVWLPEIEISIIFTNNGWKNEDEYDQNRPDNCPHSSSFSTHYGKTFGEVVHGRKMFNNYLSEREVKKIFLENKLKGTKDYNNNRPERCPHSASFKKIYGKSFSEVMYS